MSDLQFDSRAWSEYLEWQEQDKKTLKRINQLLKDILRSPYSGMRARRNHSFL